MSNARTQLAVQHLRRPLVVPLDVPLLASSRYRRTELLLGKAVSHYVVPMLGVLACADAQTPHATALRISETCDENMVGLDTREQTLRYLDRFS